MKKFNGFEAHLLEQGLKIYVDTIVDDIITAEQKGKRPIMTADYVRMIERDILEKLKNLTLKQK
jgi:hypothetical protein